MMYMIDAVIRPGALDDVMEKLHEVEIFGCTAVETKGFGRQRGHCERYRGGDLEVGFIPKIMLKICVSESFKDACVKAIQEGACNGNLGDGKIFVYKIESVVRIRTGERDHDALHDTP